MKTKFSTFLRACALMGATATLAVLYTSIASADVIKSPVSLDPWARGMSVVVKVQNRGMVRGTASFDTQTGVASFVMGLETDRVDSGPKGKMSVTLRDAAGKDLGSIDVGEIGIGGKKPGKARIEQFKGQASISPQVSARVKSIGVSVQYTGSSTQLFGVNSDDVISAIKVGAAIAAAIAG